MIFKTVSKIKKKNPFQPLGILDPGFSNPFSNFSKEISLLDIFHSKQNRIRSMDEMLIPPWQGGIQPIQFFELIQNFFRNTLSLHSFSRLDFCGDWISRSEFDDEK